MANSVVYKSPQGVHLVGGLDWALQPFTGSVDGHLREGASSRSSVSHAVVATAATAEEVKVKGKARQARRTSAGFYSTVSATKPPKDAHSLAAAFAAWTREHGRALLNVQVADGTFAVVVVDNGLPVLDKVVKTSEDARELSLPWIKEHSDISVFSDDIETYPRSLAWENLLPQIAGATRPNTALKKIPVDTAKVLLIAVLAVGALGGYWYYKKAEAEKARQLALAAQRAADPIPKYLNALAVAQQNAGVDRLALRDSLVAAMRIPLTPEGWVVKRISCMVNAGCDVILSRTTGTYAGLKAAIPFLELVPSPGINLNEARMTWTQELKPAPLINAAQLPSVGTFVQGGEASKLQTWLVAGVTLQLAPPQLWPQVPGVPASFKHPKAVAAGKFEANAIALPQLAEALAGAPENVSWTGWIAEIGDLRQEPLSRAKARLIGTYYVKNN